MRIKSELIWGESIENKDKLFDLLHAGKLPFGYYLLLGTEEGRLEIAPASMQNNRYYLSKECVIFGVARGKREAKEMICDILEAVYVTHTYPSVEGYVGEILGDKLC